MTEPVVPPELLEAAREAVREMEYLFERHEGETDDELRERDLTDALAWRRLRDAVARPALPAPEHAPDEIIHIDNEGVVRKSTVLRDPEREGPDLVASEFIYCAKCGKSCDPVNDSDTPVTLCTDCAGAALPAEHPRPISDQPRCGDGDCPRCFPAAHAPPDHGQLPEIQAYEDAAVHVAYIAEDFLRGGLDREALAEAVKRWITAQRVKDAAIDRVMARAMNP